MLLVIEVWVERTGEGRQDLLRVYNAGAAAKEPIPDPPLPDAR